MNNPNHTNSNRSGCSPICNLDYLVTVTRGNQQRIDALVSIFFTETEQELSLLDEAVKNSDYPLISSISHKLRSAFLILGISALEPVFKEMEQPGSNSSVSNTKLLYQRVILIFMQAKAEMALYNQQC